MKSVYRIIICALLVFPLSIFAQQTSPNSIDCHAAFKADVTYTCSSFLEVHFTDKSVIPRGHKITRWTWFLGDGTISNDWQPAHYYSMPGKYSVKLIIQTDGGWTDSSERIEYIKVEGKTFVDLGNDTAIEAGSSLVLDAGNPGASYSWNDGSYTQKITVTQAGEYWVHVKKGNCESRDRINVSIKSLPIPQTSFSADITYSCSSTLKVNFKEESTLGAGESITNWTWLFGDGTSSNDWRPTHIYAKPGLYTVKLTIKTNLGFTYTSERVDYIAVRGDVYVNLGNDTTIEEGASILLNAGNTGASYFWSTGDTTQGITVTTPGQYWVQVKKGNCESSDRITITNKSAVIPQTGFSADITSTCSSFLRVKFKDETILEEGDFVTRWTWIFGDGNTSNDWRPVYDYTKPGLYTVKLIIETNHGFTYTSERSNYISIEGNAYVNLGNDTSICEGNSLLLDAGNPGARFMWSTGATTQKIVVTEPGEYWVHIKKGNCESRDRIQINARPPVFPNFGFVLEGSCLPIQAKFSDSSTACGDNRIVRYAWDFGDGSSSSLQHPDHTYTSTDTFIVRLTVWDMNGFSVTRSKRVVVNSQGPIVNLGNDTAVCEVEPLVLDAGNPNATFTWSTGDIFQSCVITNSGQVWVRVELDGCVASDTIMVTVTPTMNPKFGYQIQQGTCPVTVKFADSSETCGVEITQWSWDFGDGYTSIQQHPTHTFQTDGEFIVRMTIFDNIGNVITKSKRVVIAPCATNVNLGNDTTICMGDVLMLNAGNAADSYLWSTGETTREIAVQDAGDYWVRVEKAGRASSDTVRVETVFPVNPGFDFNIKGNCLPIDVKFEDKSQLRCAQQIVQWRWDFGDGTTSVEQHPVHTYSRSDTFAVRLTITTSNGMSVSKSRKIFIENIAPVANAGSDITICKGESVQLDAGIDSASYLWTPETSLDNNSVRRPLASPLQTTTYLVAVTKCMTTTTDQVVVRVNDLVQPVISSDGKSLISSKAHSYQWFRNKEIIPGANRRNFEPKGAGFYSVKAKNAAGCQSASETFFYSPTSNKGKWTNGIKVKCTPNPSSGIVYVILSQLPEKPVALKVIDRYGQPLFTTTINNYSNLLNLSRLAKGYYMVELILGKEKVSIPVLIQ